jgi:hypothetical protein
MVSVPVSNYILVGRLQRPVSGVHSIMMEAGDGGGCAPTHSQHIYNHVQSCCVRSRADFYSIPICTLWEEGPLEGWALNSCT